MSKLIPALVLIIVCAVSALLLTFVHDVTYTDESGTVTPAIEAALGEIYGNSDFEVITLPDVQSDPAAYIDLAVKNADGEAAFVVVSDGYSKGGLTLLVGLDYTGAVKGIVTLESGETPGLGTKTDTPDFRNQFTGFKLTDVPAEVAAVENNDPVRFPKSKAELEALKAAKEEPLVLFEWDAVTGATMSSNGMYKAVCLAVTAFGEVL
jgi:electron transport complex protein RnfG